MTKGIVCLANLSEWQVVLMLLVGQVASGNLV